MIKYFILLSSMGSKKICLETTRAKCSVEAVEAVMRTEAAVGGCASRWTDGRLPTNGRRAKKNLTRRGEARWRRRTYAIAMRDHRLICAFSLKTALLLSPFAPPKFLLYYPVELTTVFNGLCLVSFITRVVLNLNVMRQNLDRTSLKT